MCGICGIVKLNNQNKQRIEETRLSKMMIRMKHRGPDDQGLFVDSSICLGHVRLSIIDLSIAGHQPMISDRYVLVFNGEIFNYLEIKEELKQKGLSFKTNTDTEVLLAAYSVWGKDCLDKFNGMFAFAIYDKDYQTVFIARDRFGVKPLYYYRSNEELIFASEIPSILEVYNKKNEANEDAIYDYLVFNRTDQTENTFFQDVFKLQHGNYMFIDLNNSDAPISISKWYNLAEKVCGKENAIKGNARDYLYHLERSIQYRLRSDVPVGVCLSGGLDSSSIVSIISKRLNNPNINTFSAIYGKDKDADESSFIDLYKEELHNMHFTTPSANTLLEDLNDFIRIQAEPMPSTGPYAQYKVMQLAQGKVKVTLDGQGADEELAGYHYFYGLYYKSLLKKFRLFTLTKEIACYLKYHKSAYALKTFAYFMLPKFLRNKVRVMDRAYVDKRFAARHNNSVISDELYGSKSIQEALINHFEYKLEHLLKWEDRNSMAFSIESRTPFLDYELVEYTLRTNDTKKIHNGFTKNILRKSMKGILPERIRLRRDKKGFGTPEDEWFRDSRFIELINSIIESESNRRRGFINCEAAKKLYNKHINKEINISKDIWKWINLELWFRSFVDE